MKGKFVRTIKTVNVAAMAAMALMLAAARPARADTKLAYVDVQRALNECDAGKKAKNEFRGRIEKLEARLQKQQTEVQSLKDELEKKGMLMKDDERRNLEDEYQRKLRDFERDYKDSKDDLEKKDNEVTGAIVKDLARIIRTIGERDGFTMVLEKGSILWGAPGIDITDEVIRNYNKSGGQVGSLGGGAEPEEGKASASAGSNFGDAAAKRSTISK
jgi:outer membrane protein